MRVLMQQRMAREESVSIDMHKKGVKGKSGGKGEAAA